MRFKKYLVLIVYILIFAVSCKQKEKYKIKVFNSATEEFNDYYFININSGEYTKFQYFDKNYIRPNIETSSDYDKNYLEYYNTNNDSLNIYFCVNGKDTNFTIKTINNYQLYLGYYYKGVKGFNEKFYFNIKYSNKPIIFFN